MSPVLHYAASTPGRGSGKEKPHGDACNAVQRNADQDARGKNTRHHGVHIHAWRNDDNVYVFDVMTRRVIRKKGKFTRDEVIHVQSFIAKHEAELLSNWELLNQDNATWFKIEP